MHTYEGTYDGPITVKQGLIHSDNTVFARLTVDVGPGKVAQVARRMGIESKLLPVPSIGLGVNDVTVSRWRPRTRRCRRSASTTQRTRSRRCCCANGKLRQAVGPAKRDARARAGVARTMSAILKENIEHGTGVNAQIGRPAAARPGRPRTSPTAGSPASRAA